MVFMPELPEVETVKLGLSRLLPGKVIDRVTYDWPKSFPNAQSDIDGFMIGASIKSVRRRGKALLIALDNDYCLVVHLKMTGQLVYRNGEEKFGAGHPSDSLVGRLPDKSTRVVIDFKDASQLFFNDQRKFGWMRLMPQSEVPKLDFFQRLGPEPLGSNFTEYDFRERIKRRQNTSIKAALLDQTVIAGVGNIYADEALWLARIHPSVPVKNLTTRKLNALYDAVRQVLLLGIEKGGSTDKNYVDAEGKKGSYLSFANVFRREGKPCPNCASTIIKIRVAGRGTHVCPKCQKAPK